MKKSAVVIIILCVVIVFFIRDIQEETQTTGVELNNPQPLRIKMIQTNNKQATAKLVGKKEVIVKYGGKLTAEKYYRFIQRMECQFSLLSDSREDLILFNPITGKKFFLNTSTDLDEVDLTGETRDHIKQDFTDFVLSKAKEKNKHVLVMVSRKYHNFLRDNQIDGVVILN